MSQEKNFPTFKQVLKAIDSLTEFYGYPPTFAEIADHFGCSEACIRKRLVKMQRWGMVDWIEHQPRTLHVIKPRPIRRPRPLPTQTNAQKLLEYIALYTKERGYSPTKQEMANYLKVSVGSVIWQLRKLTAFGALTHTPGVARSYRVIERTEYTTRQIRKAG